MAINVKDNMINVLINVKDNKKIVGFCISLIATNFSLVSTPTFCNYEYTRDIKN